MLFRVFRWLPAAPPTARGGPLHMPRDRQGAGRHDGPARYGTFYAAWSAAGAVAEAVQAFRGRELSDADLALADGSALALVTLDDRSLGPLEDLDDPQVLTRQGWRPSQVASRDREVTQLMALVLHEQGALGLTWWSTLDSAWTNVTLFAERTLDLGLVRVAEVERLTVRHPAVAQAADRLVIALDRTPRRRSARV